MVTRSDHDQSAFDAMSNVDLLGLDRVSPPAAPDRKQWISLGIFILMAIAMVATALVVMVASEKKTSVLAAEQARLAESTTGRSQILRSWLDSRLLANRRLTESDLVRLFINDMALSPVGRPPSRELLDQRPYFETLMADFADQNDLLRVTVIDEKGRLLLSSSGPPLNIADIQARVKGAPSGWENIMSPIRSADGNHGDLIIDIVVPFPKVQMASDGADKTAAVLVQTLSVNDILTDLFAVFSPRNETESVHLIQERETISERISLASSGFDIARFSRNKDLVPGQEIRISRAQLPYDRPHYILGQSVFGTGLTIIHAIEAQAALLPVNRFIIGSIGVAIVIVVAFSFSLAVLWWHRASAHHHDLISLYRSLAERLDKQRLFLGAITSSISDWLTVSMEGRFIYANPAFTKALGLTDADILGRSERDVLPLNPFQPTGDTGYGLTADEQVSSLDIRDRHYLIAACSSDLRHQNGQSIGTVTVMRDQTNLVEQRQLRHRALTDTIDAFVHTIECRDSFLIGHTQRLRSYALAVGRELALDDDVLSGLAVAASLSQLGKIFIPTEILIKPERHDQQEAVVMRSHIDHALGILGRIDFGFPVIDILGQMHERLDGSGYPNGLVGTEIGLPGRILGAVDVFCARTTPRSYRDRLSAGKTLFHLAENTTRYDMKVIATLADIVAKEGERSPDGDLDANFLDTPIWSVSRHNQRFGAAA